jgi:DHA2 family multidrug resistance protein
MSAAINAVRREQTGVAASFITIIMQIGGAFGVSLLSTILQRREFFHYAHFLQSLSNPLAPVVRQAQEAAQNLLLKSGYAPPEVVIKGKALLALWFQRQAAVCAFQDAFFFSALIICGGIVPALLIRNQQAGSPKEKTVSVGD